MTNILNWNSNIPQTSFAPNWSIPFYHNIVLNNSEISDIKKVILEREQSIINYFSETTNDGGTGLGPNSLTSKFRKFNILTWNYSWVDKIKSSIISGILSLENSDSPPSPVYAQCWANVMRKGQKIHPHWHSSFEYSYLGAHITIAAEDTKTYYENPFNKFNVQAFDNIPGSLTIFPSYLVHWTDVHNGNDERITLAMDFITKEYYDITNEEDIKNNFCLLV